MDKKKEKELNEIFAHHGVVMARKDITDFIESLLLKKERDIQEFVDLLVLKWNSEHLKERGSKLWREMEAIYSFKLDELNKKYIKVSNNISENK